MTTPQKFPIEDFGFYIDFDGDAATAEALHAVLDVLPIRDKWCVEFGAWDGLVGSTSRELILHHGYSAVLIEGDAAKFRELARNYSAHPGVITKHQFVGMQESDGLDSILATTPIPADFDLLTIDVDGNDYHIWNAVHRYAPKVVMIEFNPTIPPEVSFVQPADPSINQGSSLTAITELMRTKGYELISVIGVNAIFVKRDLFSLYGVADNRVSTLWTKRDCVTYLFTGYDGRVFLAGCQKLPWHEGVEMTESKMQPIPFFIRGYRFTRAKRVAYELLRNPLAFAKKILRRIRSS